MTVQQASRQLLFQLYHIYDEREATNIADLVMEKVTEWKRIDRIVNKESTLSPDKEKLLALYISELSKHKPVQYVLNEAWFYGMKLYVDEHVLIPRPETEELLDWIVEEARISDTGLQGGEAEERNRKIKGDGIRILDIGTGSGCIALGLKKKLPLAEIYACDVSEAALAVAGKNALAQQVTIHLVRCDFLNREAIYDLPQFTVIVSNPPYIPLKDKPAMYPNVLLYEPHLALFVEDLDPMVFYASIANFAKNHLTGTGEIFVEIHEQMGAGVKNVFTQKGFKNITLRKDLQEKERMIMVKG